MKNFQSVPQNQFRKRKMYSIGFVITENTMEWTGKWFRYVLIEEQLFFNRIKVFDEWNYSFYWGDWYPSWEFVKTL